MKINSYICVNGADITKNNFFKYKPSRVYQNNHFFMYKICSQFFIMFNSDDEEQEQGEEYKRLSIKCTD